MKAGKANGGQISPYPLTCESDFSHSLTFLPSYIRVWRLRVWHLAS
jgi:hypothetical protein